MSKRWTVILLALSWSAMIAAMSVDGNANWIGGMAIGSWMSLWSVWIWGALHGN